MLVVCAVTFVSAPGQTSGEQQSPVDLPSSGMGWSLKRLDLDVEVDADAERPGLRVTGVAHVVLDGLETSYGPTLAVNTRRPIMRFLPSEAPAGTRVEHDLLHPGAPSIRLLEVRGDELLTRGAELSVPFDVATLGELDGTGARQIIFGPNGAIASWVEGWYPVPIPRIDHNEGFSSRISAAPGTTRLHLPAGWLGMTNGARVERVEQGGKVIETWVNEVAVSRSFVASAFRETSFRSGTRDVRLLLSSPMPEAEAGQRVAVLEAALSAMEAHFGPYPYPSYGIVEVPTAVTSLGWGASSEQGFIMATTDFILVPGGNLPLFAHEAAHGWWGNLLDPEGVGGILLSESLAQYGAVLAIEAIEGPAAATEFLKFSREGYVHDQCAAGYFDILRRGEDKPLASLLSGGVDHTLSDAKGHWVFHMLRRRVGDEVFFGTLRGLLDRAGEGPTTLDDLRSAFHEAAPQAELPRFFADWLDRPGAPVLEISWDDVEGGIDLVVRQIQEAEPYQLRLDVDLTGEAEPRRHVVAVDGRVSRVHLPSGESVRDVFVDPDDRLLVWKEEYGVRPATIEGDG